MEINSSNGHKTSFDILFHYFQVLIIALACITDIRRKTPTNYIFLGIFTGKFIIEISSINYLNLIGFYHGIKKECKMIKILFLPIAAEGVSLGCCAVLYEPESVLIAVGICTGATLALTFFAFQTKWDFTNCGVFLLILLVILFISGIIMICIRDK